MRLVAGVALVGIWGCSFIGVRSPPEHPPSDQPLDCKHSYTLPVLDVVGALVGDTYGVGGLIYAGASSRYDAHDVGLLVGIPMLVIGTLYTASAVHGFTAVSRCNDLRQAHGG